MDASRKDDDSRVREGDDRVNEKQVILKGLIGTSRTLGSDHVVVTFTDAAWEATKKLIIEDELSENEKPEAELAQTIREMIVNPYGNSVRAHAALDSLLRLLKQRTQERDEKTAILTRTFQRENALTERVRELEAIVNTAQETVNSLVRERNSAEAELRRTEDELRRARQGWDGWQENALTAEDHVQKLEAALREAKLHQGLPEDAPPERVAAHFRNNREYRQGWDSVK